MQNRVSFTGSPWGVFNHCLTKSLKRMIKSIIAFSVKNKFIIGLFILAWIGWGTYSLLNLRLNTVPDLTNNQVNARFNQ